MKAESRILSVSRLKLLAPALVAVALGLGGAKASAQITDPVVALADKLAQFSQEEGLQSPWTYLTASANDLRWAVYSVLTDGVSDPNNIAAGAQPYTGALGDLAAAALATNAGSRADAPVIAASVLHAAVTGANALGDGSVFYATLQRVLNAVSGNVAAQESVAAMALSDATYANAGADVATALLPRIVPSSGLPGGAPTPTTDIYTEYFVAQTLSAASNTSQGASFVGQALTTLSQPTAKAVNAINIAKYVVSYTGNNSAAVTAAIAGGGANLADAALESYVQSALSTPVGLLGGRHPILTTLGGVQAAAVIAGATSDLGASSEAPVNFATHLVASRPDLQTLVAEGVLQGAGLPSSASGHATSDIIQAVYGPATLPANPGVTALYLAYGNGATDQTGNSRAAEAADYLASLFPGNKTIQNQIGVYAVYATSTATPAAAQQIAANIATNERAGSNFQLADAELLAYYLASSSQTGAAAGNAAKGIGSLYTSDMNTLTGVAAFASYGNAGGTANITQGLASEVSASQIENFGKLIAGLSPGQAGNSAFFGTSIYKLGPAIGGVAAALGGATVGSSNTSQAADLVQYVVSNSGLAHSQAPTLALYAALNVDEEQIANIANGLGSLYNTPSGTQGKLALSSAPTLAFYLAYAADVKQGPNAYARTRELGEIAATLVSQVLGQTSAQFGITDSSTTQSKLYAEVAEEKLIAQIGASIVAVLQKYPSPAGANGVGNVPGSLANSAGVIAGAIAQAISFGPEHQQTGQVQYLKDLQAFLLGPTYPLAQAIKAAVGTYFGQLVINSFTQVDNLYKANGGGLNGIVAGGGNYPLGRDGNGLGKTGAFPVGNLTEAETPTKSISGPAY